MSSLRVHDHTCARCRHRGCRPDRLQPAVPYRIGIDARPRHPVALQLLEITPALGALNGVKMELDDCAFPLLSEIVCTDDADVAFGDADVALLVGAMPRKAGMERSDLLSANGGIFKPQGEALSRQCEARRQGARRRQSRQHQRAHRPAQRRRPRPGTLHGDDPPRPQPGDQPDRGQARRAGDRRQEDDDLGQPLDHAVPRPVPLRSRRQGRRTRRSTITSGSRTRSSPRSPSAARRSSRPAARRRRPRRRARPIDHVRTWVAGHARGRLGVDGRSRRTAATACPRASSRASPSRASGGEYSIVQGLEIDDFSRGKIDASAAELVEERDAVAELGLI